MNSLGHLNEARAQVGKGEGCLVDIVRAEVAGEGLEVDEAGMDLLKVLGAKLEAEVVLRLEVRAGPGSFSIDLGGPSLGHRVGPVKSEGSKPLDTVPVDLV